MFALKNVDLEAETRLLIADDWYINVSFSDSIQSIADFDIVYINPEVLWDSGRRRFNVAGLRSFKAAMVVILGPNHAKGKSGVDVGFTLGIQFDRDSDPPTKSVTVRADRISREMLSNFMLTRVLIPSIGEQQSLRGVYPRIEQTSDSIQSAMGEVTVSAKIYGTCDVLLLTQLTVSVEINLNRRVAHTRSGT